MTFRHCTLDKCSLAFATTLIFVLTILFPQISSAVSVQSTRLPHPFQFTENKGQWDSAVVYKCEVRRDGFTWFLERDGVTLVTSVIDSSSLVGATPPPLGVREPPVSVNDARFDPNGRIHHSRLKSHALKFKFVDSRRGESHSPLSDQDAPTNMGASAPTGRMRFAPTDKCTTQKDVGINSDLRKYASAKWIDAQGELSWHNNYFLGNDSSKWAPDCRNFTRLMYHDVWEGIDVEFYESKGHLEFDFVVHPGADPKQIKMVCEGLEAPLSFDTRRWDFSPATSFNDSGMAGLKSHLQKLYLPTSLGELRMSIPGAYQTTANGTRGTDVTAQFTLVSENLFALDLPNGYDPTQMLRIDPLVYCTYLGGGGNDYGDGIVDDGSGGVIVCGCTNSFDFPVTAGAIDVSYNGASVGTGDCFVTRVDSTFSQLIYSTFLGGPGDDRAESIVSDSLGNSTITGYSGSQFPTTINAYQRSYNGGERDCFVSRLNSSGSRLVYSTYISGNGYDDGHSILAGDSGSVFIGGGTNSPNFPTTEGAYNTTNYGGFVVHLNNTGSGLIYSTFLGFSPELWSIASDGSGGILATGSAISGLYTTPNAFDTTYNGGETDAFVLRLNSTGSQLLYSTYLGGSGDREWAVGITGDGNGNCFVTGSTTSPNFPITVGGFDTVYNGGTTVIGDCFISYLNSTGSNLLYSTYLGGSGEDAGRGILYYADTSVTIVGGTKGTDFPTTIGAYSEHLNGTGNCFVTHLKVNTSRLIYSTYFGGTGSDVAYACMKHHSDGIIFTGICGPGFPTTPEVGDTSYNGGTDGFIARLTLIPDSSASTPERFIQPSGFALAQNYPNPFNATTTLSYSLPTTSHVDLRIYDLTGREVSTLMQREQHAGTYRVLLDGSRLASGTYFVRLQAGMFSKTQKIVLLK